MKRYLSIAALLMTISSFSYAGGNTEQAISFAQLDINHDSQLTQNEVPQNMHRNFDKIDSNSDGKIMKKEFASMQKHHKNKSDSQYSLTDSSLFFD